MNVTYQLIWPVNEACLFLVSLGEIKERKWQTSPLFLRGQNWRLGTKMMAVVWPQGQIFKKAGGFGAPACLPSTDCFEQVQTELKGEQNLLLLV